MELEPISLKCLKKEKKRKETNLGSMIRVLLNESVKVVLTSLKPVGD